MTNIGPVYSRPPIASISPSGGSPSAASRAFCASSDARSSASGIGLRCFLGASASLASTGHSCCESGAATKHHSVLVVVVTP